MRTSSKAKFTMSQVADNETGAIHKANRLEQVDSVFNKKIYWGITL